MVYAMILETKLRKEVELKGIVPQNQTGCRKGMGMVDNIYVVNYLVNKQLGKKKGDMIVLVRKFRGCF